MGCANQKFKKTIKSEPATGTNAKYTYAVSRTRSFDRKLIRLIKSKKKALNVIMESSFEYVNSNSLINNEVL